MRHASARVCRVLAALAGATLAGCAHSPSPIASELGERVLKGNPFEHRVFSSGHPGSGTLHVYIEGDGRAWLNRTTVSHDPTPRATLMLDLMTLDSSPSVYVGRPCYFALARSPGCSPREWTSRRYSAEAVASLESVIRQLLAEGRYEHVVLFGHSGGGTLATLLASRMPEVDGLVTLAANLNVAGWTALHGYTPLSESLDPATLSRFPAGIFQVHWLGSDDDDVPPSLFAAVQPLLGDGEVRVREGFDHACCWKEIWPTQLTEVANRLAGADSRARLPLASSAVPTTGLKENLR